MNQNISFFTDKEFHEARLALDAQMKKGAREGLVKIKKQAVVINTDDENTLWMKGIFGSDNGCQLVKTLIYHLGLHLSLRAAQEHRDLEYGKTLLKLPHV